MSDRQTLAQCVTGLCLAGFSPWVSAVFVPAAVLGAFLLDLRARCDKRLASDATSKALAALTDTPDLTDADIRTARAWLDHRRDGLSLDPHALAAAAKTGDLPNALYDLIVDNTLAADGGARRAVRLALDAAYQACRLNQTYHTIFTQEVLIDLASAHGLIQTKLDAVKDDTAAIRSEMAEMKALLLQRLQTEQPQTYADHSRMIIGLAQNYAANPDGTPITDVDTAYRGLENALRVAADLRAQNALPRNASDQIDAILVRVQTLNAAAEFDRADQALAAARAEAAQRIAEQTSGLMRLWDSTLAQATLRNRPEQAAEALVERLMLDAPADPYAAVRLIFLDWHDRGQDKGIDFDSSVAIHLAERMETAARTPDQRGAARHNLGMALSTLGEREPGTARLEAALTAYGQALADRTRDRVPLDWAATQHNIGTVLESLGRREPGPARLNTAVAAYTDALQEYTRDRAPEDWAMTQTNLGNALAALGSREPGTADLERAVAAFAEALQERNRDRAPLDWAATQTNLGNALHSLGWRETGTLRLEQAVAAHRHALLEYTQDRLPLNWATTHNNLGNVLTTIGKREPGTARLADAQAAYAEALKERTKERVPLSWAATQGNMARVELAFFDKTADPVHLARARAHATAAKEVFVAAKSGHQAGIVDEMLADITAREAR